MTNLTGSPEVYGPPGTNYGTASDAEMAIEDTKMVAQIVTNGWHADDSNSSFLSSTPMKKGRGRPNKRKLSLDSTDSTASSETLMKKSKLARTLLEDGKHGVIDGRWVCGECGKSLSSAGGLDQHLTTVHGEYKFPCEFCSLKFKRKDHVMNHTRRVHECAKKCSKCGKEFIGREAYAEHMKAVHKIKLTFRALRKDRKNHVVLSSSSPNNKKVVKSKAEEIKTEFKIPSSSPSKLGNYECKHCMKRFASDLKLHHHTLNVHKEELMLLPCTLCRRFFTGATCLNRHKNHHHRSSHDFVKCSYCSGVFHEQVSLEAHLKFFHAEEECLVCGSVFTGAFEMYDHISDFHAPYLTPYGHHTCGLCGAYYRFRHHAVEHFRRRHVYHWNYVQVARQVHSCPHCQFPFDDWNELNNHVLAQHGSYGFWYLEPEYVAVSAPDQEDSLTLLPCAVCNDLYHDQVSLDKHIANDHEPFATRRPFNRKKVTFEIANIEFAAYKDLNSWKIPGFEEQDSMLLPALEEIPASNLSKKVTKKRGRKPKIKKAPPPPPPEPEPEPPKLPRSKIKKIIIPKKRTLKKRAMIEARRKAKLKEQKSEPKSEAENDDDSEDDDEPEVVDKDNTKIDTSNIITGSRTRHAKQPTPQKRLPQRTPPKSRKKRSEPVKNKKVVHKSESESESESEEEPEIPKKPLSRKTTESSQKVTTNPPPKRRYLIKDDPNIFDDSDEEIMPTPKRRGNPTPKKKSDSETESESESEEEQSQEEEESDAEERPLSRTIIKKKPVKKIIQIPVELSEEEEEESEEESEETESDEADMYDELLLMTPKVTLRTMRKSVIRRYSTDLRSPSKSNHQSSDETINGNEDHEEATKNHDEKENNHQNEEQQPVLMNGHHEPNEKNGGTDCEEKSESIIEVPIVDHATTKVADLKKDILVESANNGNLHLENGIVNDDTSSATTQTEKSVQETPELTAMS